jgi:hypothetical protein
MKLTIVNRLIILALTACTAAFAAPAPKPAWLDTIPPVVEIQPRSTFHNKIILVTAKANEPARIWISKNSKAKFEEYSLPITIAEQGQTLVYYYAEDDFGNKSKIDSILYTIDMQPPEITVVPPSGYFRAPVTIHFSASEPCRFYLRKAANEIPGKPLPDSVVVTDQLQGFVAAMDFAGNWSVSARVYYRVDTSKVLITLTPEPGIYNTAKNLKLAAVPATPLFYSFDPLAPADWFTAYTQPVLMPYGLTVVRYYAKDSAGIKGDIQKATYVVDTIPPRIKLQREEGNQFDSITLSTREPSVIHYTTTLQSPNDDSPVYSKPIAIKRSGMGRITAFARDSAGNLSDMLEWTFKYDSTPPTVTMSPTGGEFNKPFTVLLKSNEPARFLYTEDGNPPLVKGSLYNNSILVSKEGKTIIRAVALDEADNVSAEVSGTFLLDTRPPEVRPRIEGSIDDNTFYVSFTATEQARIFYEVGDKDPTPSSPVYKDKIPLKLGDVLRYKVVDEAGNATPVLVLDELRKPLVSASPNPGMYNRRIKVSFTTSVPSHVLWRILPDTVFRAYVDSLVLAAEGPTVLEYYSQTKAGLRSPVKRQVYTLDMTSPRVGVTVRKAVGDTVNIFFEASENATIYYTLDGSNPQFSVTTKVAGNKFRLSKDRVSVRRSANAKLAFYAEDLAGNQSSLSVIDIFKPHAVPNVPAGPDRVYDKVLSLMLSTMDQSQIYYSRHGRTPTVDSAVFRDPITLMQSDTLCTFVIDASGYVGPLDTFIYLIDLPPSPALKITPPPETLMVGTTVRFDASGTVDNESPLSALLFQWDFDGDGKPETDFSSSSTITYAYPKAGLFTAILSVKDPRNRVATLSRPVRVLDKCLRGMVFVIDPQGHSFCIDRYEWPNLPNRRPVTGVSWVEAKMYCVDAGKRLCTRNEWQSACQGLSHEPYPYGPQYEKTRCATEGEQSYTAGSFPNCKEGFGTRDMIGNVWEWVHDRTGDLPILMGGSYVSGKDAYCGFTSTGTVASKSADAGFRCCR